MGLTTIIRPFYWVYLGFIGVVGVIINIFRWSAIGLFTTFKSLVLYIIHIFRYAISGVLFIFKPIINIFDKTSGSVYKAYTTTKKQTETLKEKQEAAKVVIRKKKEEKKKQFTEKQRAKYELEKAELLKELNPDDVKRTDEKQIYRYVALDKEGNIVKGIFGAFSKLDVNSYLVNEGYEVFSIKTSNFIQMIYGPSKFKGSKMSTKDLIFWLTQLNTYIKSGIPLTDAMKILANQMGKKGNRKRLFSSIVYELSMGETFSAALEHQEGVFPSLLINMLRAAEATGELEETLDDMATYYTEMNSTRKAMISAMTYPSIITVFSFGVITFIMLYVIPQFVKVYQNAGIKIAGLTGAIINLSVFLRNNILYILLILVVIIIIFSVLYKRLKAFRATVQNIMMHIPLMGNIIIYNEITIFTKTFASLLRNNVLITDSVKILSKVTSNEIYKDVMFETIDNITKGEKISESFKDHWAVPEVAYYMLVTGESTGELPEMMSTVSRYYQELHKNLINNLKAFIEPIMIVSLSIIVGVIILAVIIPMFDLYSQVA